MSKRRNKNGVKGYKVFEPDWTCRGYQYEVGKTFEENVKPELCGRGFHFCEKAVDCFNYYAFNPENKVAEVIALGDIDSGEDKSCTNKIQIVREIPWDEVLRIVNIGKNCTGLGNTGKYNTGYKNTGDWDVGSKNTGDFNIGCYNTGNKNTGNMNTGNKNAGYYNTGNKNTGSCNTGNWNVGNRNVGDWNTSSFNTGCFNTTEQKILMFNKPSDWTYEMWLYSDARDLLNQIPKNVVQWIESVEMTDKEKAIHRTHKTTGGYLKVLDESECGQIWWDRLPKCDKDIIKALPNFDAEIFKECTGIDVTKEM